MIQSRAAKFLDKAATEGKFGNGAQIIENIFDESRMGEDQFMSSVVFITVKLKQENVIRNVDVLVKMQQGSEFLRQNMNVDSQFYNEVLMYEEILPFLNINDIVNDIFPKNFYCYSNGEIENDVIVIQDLKGSGFTLSKERLFLDYDHCILTLKQIGRYHALSYAAKQRNLKQFIEKIDKIKETRFINKEDKMNRFYKLSMERGILGLAKKGEYIEVLENFTRRIEDTFKFMKSLIIPEEPMAVLCHGDFCRNNILYKYQENKPKDIKLFDLATPRYASPAIDISFFIFLNVPSEIRREHWDDLIRAYHDGLSSAIPDITVPSLDMIIKELSKKAVYAYIPCSAFIPIMIGGVFNDEEGFWDCSEDQFDNLVRERGGDEATEIVEAVLRDLIFNKCL